jgi:hypothetical protein
MDPMTLRLAQLAVDTFEITAPEPVSDVPAGMKTYEPGCTTPELCPNNTTVVVVIRTMEPGCTTPELCPNNTTVAALG